MIKRSHITLGIIAGILTIVFTYLCQLRYEAFFSYEWEDIAWINGFMWNVSKGNWQIVKEYFLSSSYTSLHVVWLNYILSVVYWLFPDIQALYFLSSFAVCSSIIPLHLIAKASFNEKVAWWFTAVFILYVPKYNLIFLDGDPSIFSLPLLAWLFYFGFTNQLRWYMAFCLLLGICRTETPLTFALCSTYFFLIRSPSKDNKYYLLSASVGYVWFLLNILMYLKINEVNPAIDLASGSPLLKQGLISKINFENLRPFLTVFWPLLFLPVLALETLLGLPSLMMALISSELVVQRSHYLVAVLVSVQIGTIFSVKIISTWIDRRFKSTGSLPYILALLLVSNFVALFGSNILGKYYKEWDGDIISDRRFLGVTNMFDPKIYERDPSDDLAWELVKRIPREASVSATGDLLPPLSSRKVLFEVLDPINDYLDVDYVIIHHRNMYFGAGHYHYDHKKLEEIIEKLKADRGWETLYGDKEFWLFKRR